MSVSRQEIKEALGKMPVMDLVSLIKELEAEWGVSAAAPVAVAAPARYMLLNSTPFSHGSCTSKPSGKSWLAIPAAAILLATSSSAG